MDAGAAATDLGKATTGGRPATWVGGDTGAAAASRAAGLGASADARQHELAARMPGLPQQEWSSAMGAAADAGGHGHTRPSANDTATSTLQATARRIRPS